MRAAVFRVLLKCISRRTPEILRRVQLQILLNATAEGFDTEAIRIWHKNAADALHFYAEFTKKCMMQTGQSPEKLYDVSWQLGANLRRITGFTKQADLEKLVFFLYRGIGISMSGCIPGEITVSRCFFSDTYSPAQCQYISAMDRGIVSGIFGGGELKFIRRITEGCSHCTAYFKEKDQNE